MFDGEKRLYSVIEVAERLSVSRSLVYKLIRSGELRTVRLGGAIRIRPDELTRLVDESTGWTRTTSARKPLSAYRDQAFILLVVRGLVEEMLSRRPVDAQAPVVISTAAVTERVSRLARYDEQLPVSSLRVGRVLATFGAPLAHSGLWPRSRVFTPALVSKIAEQHGVELPEGLSSLVAGDCEPIGGGVR